MYWNSLLFCMIALLGRVERSWGCGANTMPCVRSAADKGLGAWGLLPLEGSSEALQAQVVIPLLGELLVVFV
jgi:hypothetical protein